MHFFVKITSSRSFFCSYQRGKNSSPGGWLENWITHWPMETWPWTAIQFQWNSITQHQLLVLHHSTPPQHHPNTTQQAPRALVPHWLEVWRLTISTALAKHTELTIRRHQDLIILRTPANGVKVCCHYVTPEIRPAVISIAAVTKQQELSTCCNDRSHPVRVRIALVGHF